MNLSEQKKILKSFLEIRGFNECEIERILEHADSSIISCIDHALSWSRASIGYFKCKLICVDWVSFLYSVSTTDESKKQIKDYLRRLVEGYHNSNEVVANMHDRRFFVRASRYLE
jgi:hypothetical protein